MAKLFRLYIDESGTHNYSTAPQLDKRYLGLTGIIVDSEIYEAEFQPRITNLKKLFSNDPDDLPILHRDDIVNKTGAFAKLNDPTIEAKFNTQFISLIKDVDYSICTVVIDKTAHFAKYQKSANHPYHYCLTAMLERYAHFLEIRGRGDVCAESRGRIEDMALKDAYEHFYSDGTYFRSKEYVQTYLTSREIKIKPKDKSIAGLELADLLALPTKLDVLKTNGILTTLTENFTKQIIDLIQKKYCRGNRSHNVKGYGKKLL